MNTNPHTTYTSEKGRTYRVSGIEKIPDSEKWINQTEKHKWIVTIIFTDNQQPRILKLLYNHNDKLYETRND